MQQGASVGATTLVVVLAILIQVGRSPPAVGLDVGVVPHRRQALLLGRPGLSLCTGVTAVALTLIHVVYSTQCTFSCLMSAFTLHCFWCKQLCKLTQIN